MYALAIAVALDKYVTDALALDFALMFNMASALALVHALAMCTS